MRVLTSIVISFLFISTNFGLAVAATVDVEGMPIRPGDTVSRVQEIYHTTLAPEPYDSPSRPGGSVLRLEGKGVWLFFDKDGITDTIRLEPPFQGAVNGVKIGDTSAKMLEVLGKPVRTFRPPVTLTLDANFYDFDDQMTARFDLDQDQKVATVFLFKGKPQRKAEIVAATPPASTAAPDQRLTVPSDLNELNGCWRSIKGDLPVLSGDQEHRVIGHRRICYCFSGNGNGQVLQIILEGGRCVAPLQAQLSEDRLTISHGDIPCTGVPANWGDSIASADIVCTRKPGDDLASCERFAHAKFPVTFRNEVFHRVDTEECR